MLPLPYLHFPTALVARAAAHGPGAGAPDHSNSGPVRWRHIVGWLRRA